MLTISCAMIASRPWPVPLADSANNYLSISTVAAASLTSWIIIAVIVGGSIIFGITIYNGMVSRLNQVENAQASVDAILKKRHDLIPKLVDSVKEYIGYEAPTIKDVVELRNQVKSQEGLNKDRIQKEDQISRDLEKIQVQVEDYPDLKASENFVQLQQSLNEVEEELAAARRFLNSAVKNYHDSIQMFPHRIIAGMLSFQEQEYFETAPAERQDVNMKNLFS